MATRLFSRTGVELLVRSVDLDTEPGDRPEYEDRYHTHSKTPCPFCGGRVWVDFGWAWLQGEEAEPLWHFTPMTWIDSHSPGLVCECVNCGAVVS